MISSRPHPTLSIVMPSYNQARFLRRAIESVLVHSDVDLELLVFDGGSTDGSVEILESIDDPRLRFVSRPDRGQADAINQGFAMARGEIMAWLNSDDEYVPGALPFVLEHFKDDPDCLALYGDVDMVDESGRVLRRYPTKAWTPERMARKCYISQPSVFVRREVIETAGPLMLQLMLCLDYEYWHRIARDCPWQTVDRVLAHTRIYAETKTSSRRMRGIVEGCCVSRYYHGRLPLRWSVKYMCRRARLQPQRYLLTPAGWLRWLSIPTALSRRCCPDRTRSGWIRRLYESLEDAPHRSWEACRDQAAAPSRRSGLARTSFQVDETRA